MLFKKYSSKTLEDYLPDSIIKLDGVRAQNKNGWWLIRASNTEEKLVIRVEGTFRKK